MRECGAISPSPCEPKFKLGWGSGSGIEEEDVVRR
jgi:hypothetical protein